MAESQVGLEGGHPLISLGNTDEVEGIAEVKLAEDGAAWNMVKKVGHDRKNTVILLGDSVESRGSQVADELVGEVLLEVPDRFMVLCRREGIKGIKGRSFSSIKIHGYVETRAMWGQISDNILREYQKELMVILGYLLFEIVQGRVEWKSDLNLVGYRVILRQCECLEGWSEGDNCKRRWQCTAAIE